MKLKALAEKCCHSDSKGLTFAFSLSMLNLSAGVDPSTLVSLQWRASAAILSPQGLQCSPHTPLLRVVWTEEQCQIFNN